MKEDKKNDSSENVKGPADPASFGSHYDIKIASDPDDLFEDSRVLINIGPTHPAMHGAFLPFLFPSKTCFSPS